MTGAEPAPNADNVGKPQMRVGISGTHGTGKTTLAGELCAHLPGQVTAEEPYYLLEEERYEFAVPVTSPAGTRRLDHRGSITVEAADFQTSLRDALWHGC
jgi:pantothenate kinase-related protein Tda10